MSTLLERFTDALEAHAATWTRTAPASFAETLEELVEEPAVAVELPFEDVTLPARYRSGPLTPERLERAETGITGALLGVASYGTIALAHDRSETEPVSLYVPRHLAVLRTRDLVPDLESAFERLGDRIRSDRIGTVLATGPSATADMGALVRGAHGPREVHVLIVEDTAL